MSVFLITTKTVHLWFKQPITNSFLYFLIKAANYRIQITI